ncbi:Pleckstrin homology domain-containing family A member 5 [Sciurus carolinensis]|uniref:Pleckstrin homology domain-containing family A member 5 n=1 Tax=Sciurus carolinensis TaxID=30640 RepID=A0AA41MQ57_SCICA|nr:Pleckstrin homology domain-containing family A member 5 [Sciurus carolinensis]
MSASVNRKQNSSFLPEEKKQPPSDSKICRGKENDDPPLAISHQLKKTLPVVMFNDCEESLSEKITQKDFKSTVENCKPEKGKFITEVKCGAFNVQVEIKKNIFCKTGAQFPTKKVCPTCHQRFSARLTRRCYASRRCFPKYNNTVAEKLKPEPSSKQGEMIRTDSPSLKVNIVGKEIKVKYVSKKQNILINITHPKRRGKITKYRNISSNPTPKEPFRSPSQSDIKHPEKQQLENKHQSLDGSQASPPVVCTIQKNSDTVLVSLTSTPKREKNKSVSVVSDDSEGESAISQQKIFKISHNTPEKKQFSGADALPKNILPTSHDTLKTTHLSNIYLSKTPFEDSKDVDKERKINFAVPENITSDSNTQQITDGRNPLLSTITNIVPIQDVSDSDFCSLSSLSIQLLGEKTTSIYCKGNKTSPTEGYKNSNSTSFSSIQNALKSSTSFSPSHLEPKDTLKHTFSFNHCTELVIDHEKEHSDMTETNINKAFICSDSCANAQQLLERKSIQGPNASPASCSNLADESTLHDISHGTVEWDQTEAQKNHPETVASSRTKVSVMTFVIDKLEQRLITQNDKEHTIDSNGPLEMRNSKESPNSLGNVENDKCEIIPVIMNACHRDFEDLPSENHDEICFQMDFPPNTAETNCKVCAMDKLFLIEKTLHSGADQCGNQYGIQDEKDLELTSFQHQSAECQRISSTKPDSEGDENEKDYSHQIDILLSPQKQKAWKDQNLEISSLRKFSQELTFRGARASDGSQEEAIDQWARRRQQFRDGRRCNSTGGSSFTSNITEGSITSEEGRSMDFGFRVDIEEKGFYTENFHSAAWVFQGDDGNPEDSPRCLSKKPRPVAVRERTVRLFKGTGDYPWGFRIQFSKPIMVTEVDTNSAAEEAGLLIGDVVLSVNGTEVTSVEHAEAVHLARKGSDILTLVVGSDISHCPNTPRPTCRGYLHKRTHSGFVKGWRKRWFVLKHDGCLHYYKHKKDEGKWPPLQVIKLEGADIGIDSSLGKPLVFNCVPQSGNRSLCLCATSNQEMKRWLEAMEKAAHPIRQNHVWEDVTLHNSSLPPLAIKNPECLGLLHQLDRHADMWVQHYCILKDGCLYFYASIRSTRASGGLYLQGYRVSEQTHSFKQSVIELEPPSEEFKTFYFCAENKTENQR